MPDHCLQDTVSSLDGQENLPQLNLRTTFKVISRTTRSPAAHKTQALSHTAFAHGIPPHHSQPHLFFQISADTNSSNISLPAHSMNSHHMLSCPPAVNRYRSVTHVLTRLYHRKEIPSSRTRHSGQRIAAPHTTSHVRSQRTPPALELRAPNPYTLPTEPGAHLFTHPAKLSTWALHSQNHPILVFSTSTDPPPTSDLQLPPTAHWLPRNPPPKRVSEENSGLCRSPSKQEQSDCFVELHFPATAAPQWWDNLPFEPGGS